MRLSTGAVGRGGRARLARQLRCRPAFVSQVLNGAVHFSVEHAIEVDRFLQHGPLEAQYFMAMVHKDRSGSKKLEAFYLDEMQRLHRERARVTRQVNAPALSQEAAARYYSSWVYSAAHVWLMTPQVDSVDQLARHLGVSLDRVQGVVDCLVQLGLVERRGERLRVIQSRLHLSDDSDLVQQHHGNWRMRALHAVESPAGDSLHYGGPIAISKANAVKIRALLLQCIQELEPILRESDEEHVCAVIVDFFSL